jgi:hypothetical protein
MVLAPVSTIRPLNAPLKPGRTAEPIWKNEEEEQGKAETRKTDEEKKGGKKNGRVSSRKRERIE